MNQLGPNSPCHCGSGRKYKRCCKRVDAAAPAPPSRSSPVRVSTREGSLWLPGTRIDATHPAFAALQALVALEAACSDVEAACLDHDGVTLATAAAALNTVADDFLSVWGPLGQVSPPFAGALTSVRHAASALADCGELAGDDRVSDFITSRRSLDSLSSALTVAALELLGVDFRSEEDFGAFWFADAQLRSRDGLPYVTAALSVRLYPTHSAPGALFSGRAALWGLSGLELDDALDAIRQHDDEGDLDPEAYLRDIMWAIGERVRAEGVPS